MEQENTNTVTTQTAIPSHIVYSPEIKRGEYYLSVEHKNVLPAFQKAVREIEKASKDKTNAFYNNAKYADLAGCMDVVKPALEKYDLAITQPASMERESKSVTIDTHVMHESGEYIRWEFTLPFGDKLTAQEVGKGVTYARRYALSGVGIITDVDDDGSSASGIQDPKNKRYSSNDNQSKQQPREQSQPKQQDPPKQQEKAKAAEKQEEPVTTTSSPAIDKVLKDLSIARNCEVKAIVNYSAKRDIDKQPEEDQVRYYEMCLKNHEAISAIGNFWQSSGKSFHECLNDVNADVDNLGSISWIKPKK